jgi:hypothetical protein
VEARPPTRELINLPLIHRPGHRRRQVIGWYLDAGAKVASSRTPTPSGPPHRRRRVGRLPAGMHLPRSPWPFLAPMGLGVLFFGLVFNPVFILAGLLMAIVAAGAGTWMRGASTAP